MSEKPSLSFARPEYGYDELEAQLTAYTPNPATYPHDIPSIISIEEAQCSPVLKEISRQVWLNSIEPAVNQFLDRY